MNKLILILVIATILSGCFRERIDLDYNVDDNKKLVITAWITTLDEPQFVEISNTVNYLGAFTPDGVGGAVVKLSDESDTYELVENERGKYYLPANWEAQVGDKYSLKVIVEGKEYTATHTMRKSPEIDYFIYRISEDLMGEDSTAIYETAIGFQELPGEGDAYYGLDYLKGTAYRDSLSYGQFTNDDFIDGVYFDDVVLSEDERLFALGDTAVVELHSIGKETADFLNDILLEVFRGSPFDAPPANVRTNISGGAIGYFVVADSRIAQLIIE